MRIIKLDQVAEVDLERSFRDAVVIPTETVYGLAARIDNERALKSIFEIKGRPSDNPLIVHISDLSMLGMLVEGGIPADYEILMETFWPGPLTLLFKCKSTVSKTIIGKNSDTVAVRMPRGNEVRQLIRSVGVPLAAPSANTSGKPSPTRVEHAVEDLGDKVSLYIDGGPCEVGLESTVFSNIDGNPMILRPGSVTKENVENVIKKKVEVRNKLEEGAKAISPGQKYKHYSPEHPVYLFIGFNWATKMAKLGQEMNDKRIGLLRRDGVKYPISFHDVYDLGFELKSCTKEIFSGLRALDKSCDVIFIVGFEIEDEGLAIMDRIEKAATHIVE